MKVYYQVVLSEDGIIVGLNSSDKPFSERQVTTEQVKLIKFGKTKFETFAQ